MKEFYNGGVAPEFSVLMLKETIALVRDYVSETRKWEAKLAEKYIWKRNMKSFSNETLLFFFSKFYFSYILDLAKTVAKNLLKARTSAMVSFNIETPPL